jgi:hypothetical protein
MIPGAGKSTLIKMLIDYQECTRNPNAAPSFPSPVVGSAINDQIATSADVHLYADPATYHGLKPMLFADCEGLDGGEEAPMAIMATKSVPRGKLQKSRRIVRLASGRVRDIAWATTPQKCTRQFAVGELYPRVLYTFSDTVVFVLRNAK